MKNLFSILLIFFVLSACATFLPPSPSPENLINTIKNQPPPPPFKGSGRIWLKTFTTTVGLRYVLTCASKDSCRLEVIGPLGNLAFILVKTPATLEIYFPSEGRLLESKLAHWFLEDYLPPGIDIEDFSSFLCGQLPAEIREEKTPTITTHRGKVLLTFEDEKFKAVAVFSRRNWNLTSFLYYSSVPDEYYQVKFQRYRKWENFSFPTRVGITAVNPEGKSEMKIELYSLKVNPDIPENFFQIPRPN